MMYLTDKHLIVKHYEYLEEFLQYYKITSNNSIVVVNKRFSFHKIIIIGNFQKY